MALVPFLPMKSLLCFMSINKKCKDLTLFQLIQHRDPLPESTNQMFMAIFKLARVLTAELLGASDLPRSVKRLLSGMDDGAALY